MISILACEKTVNNFSLAMRDKQSLSLIRGVAAAFSGANSERMAACL